jgi:hypothetical protein
MSSTDFSIFGNTLVLISEGVIQGIIFAMITAPILHRFIDKQGEISAT